MLHWVVASDEQRIYLKVLHSALHASYAPWLSQISLPWDVSCIFHTMVRLLYNRPLPFFPGQAT